MAPPTTIWPLDWIAEGLDHAGGIGIEVHVDRAVGVEPRRVGEARVSRSVPSLACSTLKLPPMMDLAVGLEGGERRDRIVGIRIEGRIDRAVGVEPCDVIAAWSWSPRRSA